MVSAESDILHPLTLFRRSGGHPLPPVEILDGNLMPEPYGTLLVHTGDMTSRLENYHSSAITLRVLHKEATPAVYRREVALVAAETGNAVEYGAIEIQLDAFDQQMQRHILEAQLPLGGLLNRYDINYRSQPRAFFRMSGDPMLCEVFDVSADSAFFGRSNDLLGENDRVLARIVEVLRP